MGIRLCADDSFAMLHFALWRGGLHEVSRVGSLGNFMLRQLLQKRKVYLKLRQDCVENGALQVETSGFGRPGLRELSSIGYQGLPKGRLLRARNMFLSNLNCGDENCARP